MKNKEKYAKEIMEIACNGNSIAIIRESGRVAPCYGTPCVECLFNGNKCKEKTREWVESEYIEKPVISRMDRAFLEYLKGYKYIAIDYGGKLCAYVSIPKKIYDGWGYASFKSLAKLDIDFPMVKWSDSEPWLIEDLKKLEVVEEYE